MDDFNTLVNSLNQNAYFSGIMMILLNIGSKYVVMEISDTQEQFLSNIIVRRLLVFTVFFTATRDIYTSFILSAIFVIFVSGLFNEKSQYCILPKHIIHTPKEGRTISPEEIEYAKKILDISNKQKVEKKDYLNDLQQKKEEKKKIYKENLKSLSVFKD
jgi:hypothetical protein